MRPAFSSTKQAALFTFIVFFVLLLPILLLPGILPSRSENYLTQGWTTFGNLPYLSRQIFQEKTDVDVAFVGASKVWEGVDTSYVQQKLSERLGRPAVVRTIAWGGSGFDTFFFVVRDLLENRKVKMVVFDDASEESNYPHPLTHYWFRFDEDAKEISGFPTQIQLDYYFAAILGAPRLLLDLCRSNIPCEIREPDTKLWGNGSYLTNQLGSVAMQQGFCRPSKTLREYPKLDPFVPVTGAQPSDCVLYSAETKNQFEFSEGTIPQWQINFARQFAALVIEKHAKLVQLHIPDLGDIGHFAIPERTFWPDSLRANVAMIGIPPGKLFGGLKEEEALKLFADPVHLNQNGQQYFTPLVTPKILQLYETATNN